MAPSSSVIALTLAFGIGGRSGDSFCLQNLGWTSSAACSRRRPRPATAVANTPTTAGLAAQGEGGSGYRGGSNENGRYENFLGQTSAGTEETDEEAAEEALRRQVFSNEKGFLESSAFNPARARAEREEEEARALAVQWGSTPERAKEVIKRTKEDKDLSFQELEGIAQELNMSDEQQRAFMLQASMKKLSAATALPRRAPSSRVKEAVSERVFASEKGFLKNSAAFKSRLQVGSGVRFDSQGFPVADVDDPVIQAAKKTAKPLEASGIEGVTFPSLPDCPCCSTPTMEDELSQFGMCSQCKGLEISSKAYSGPQVASKYTYDNGDAPFSAAWTVPPSKAAGTTPAAKDRPEKASRGASSPPPPVSSSAVPAVKDRPYKAARGGGGGGGGSSSTAATAVAARTTAGGVGAANAAAVSAEAAAASSKRDRGTGTASRGAAAAQRKPAPGRAAAAVTGAAPAPAAEAAADARRASTANGVADKASFSGSTAGSSAAVPAASRTTTTTGAARGKSSIASRASPAAVRDEAQPPGVEGAAPGDAAFRKLRLEVAELRTHLVINRAALARVESMGGGRTPEISATRAAAGAGAMPATRVANSGKALKEDEHRDTALRKLKRDVAELRRELSGLDDKVSDAVDVETKTSLSRGSRGGEGGDTEAVQKMKREVAELRSQLESARKETALTRSALRRLQGDVDDLRKAVASR